MLTSERAREIVNRRRVHSGGPGRYPKDHDRAAAEMGECACDGCFRRLQARLAIERGQRERMDRLRAAYATPPAAAAAPAPSSPSTDNAFDWGS